MMTVIAKQYDQWWIEYPAYTLAVSVALQRMDDRQHWFSDVVMGGAIGYWVSSTLVSRHQGKTKSQPFIPYFAANQIGIRMNF
jgi:membrane-associated phospholipid phosphatase